MTCVKRASRFRLVLRATPAVGALALTAALSAPPARGADYTWPFIFVEVIDGDTIKFDVPSLPPELASIKVRLRGVDAPEKAKRAQCLAEKKASRAAKAFTKQQIDKAKRIVVRDPKWGAFRGRVIADLVLDGRSLSAALIEGGYGIRDHGKQTKEERKENRRKRWCSSASGK